MIELVGISKIFNHGSERIELFKDLSFFFMPNRSYAITGASGVGKTLLLMMIAGLEEPTAGLIKFNGKVLATHDEKVDFRLRSVGLVFQNSNLCEEFTALENVALKLLLAGRSLHEAKSEARKFLEKLGLEDRLSSYPEQLSGGEKQRVAIARAMCSNPQILLLDEPTGSLDPKTAEIVSDLISSIAKHISYCIVVTHNIEFARRFDYIYQLKPGGVLVQIN
ncbi:MAG: ABC transporter ATP-binding protein [Deltaproteobacteria bacterium]|nr:ABC transporter ATP-binding protein [Deltaproteobacteria bacterium]